MTRILLALTLALPSTAFAVPVLVDQDRDGFEFPLDCDDSNPSVYPGAQEIPGNGVDENCDGVIDGFAPDLDADGYPEGVDCDDNNALVFPGADERCNGVDDDCNGTIDDNAVDGFLVFSDNDRDGYGVGAGSLECLMPPDTATQGGDCDDTNPAINPGAEEVLNNGIDDNCDDIIDGDTDPIEDEDEDGSPWNEDCDDTNADVYPGAPEVCDGLDNNCDGAIDESCTTCVEDAYEPNDGLASATVATSGATMTLALVDSDDYLAFTVPAGETLNVTVTFSHAVGDIDVRLLDGGVTVDLGGSATDDELVSYVNTTGVDATVYLQVYTFGNNAGCIDYSVLGTVTQSVIDFDGDGFLSDVDCNDTDPTVFPGAVEVCDGIDNNCDGTIDEGLNLTWYFDGDGDGYGDGAPGNTFATCAPPPDHVALDGDCDDANPAINPGAEEVLNNGIDDNCDGIIDGDPDPIEDEDGDGSPWDEDCDDTDGSIYPGAAEVCDGLDNDCDGIVDEGVGLLYLDEDGDGFGHGLPANTPSSCEAGVGYSNIDGDCDDSDPAVNPDAVEIPNNGIDENCDGMDGSVTPVDQDGDGYPATTDCDDTDASVFPGAVEIAGDGIDQDCDGVDTVVLDNDGDGYAPPDDCDDQDPTTFPGAPEACEDGIDQDCDGVDGECEDEPPSCSSSGGGATFALLFLAPLLWRRRG